MSDTGTTLRSQPSIFAFFAIILLCSTYNFYSLCPNYVVGSRPFPIFVSFTAHISMIGNPFFFVWHSVCCTAQALICLFEIGSFLDVSVVSPLIGSHSAQTHTGEIPFSVARVCLTLHIKRLSPKSVVSSAPVCYPDSLIASWCFRTSR